ncbi:5'-3' exonuclease H3TH domain-containing protein [Tsukamurella sp. 8F]|uniref:5'-3' exonuclease n=1 Tax=unclassified Tsukamurella TaxID=2633480 RepID=UPI0023B93D2A|nr:MULTISPECIES: 5'-3' exonuclease H3TH domain-containing protein [unclassified Tsukamurella]MDF0530555.1 5'-3' exonuclease H3TH domain-containing protein [Tsukamurella sp. 8J]MDF0586795.1 5'-3' exonuclease H3TH domain-containing protein [Tsukamurella sp. 8F]
MLLDSAGLWFRAFYAIPDKVTTDDGRSINAVRGFLDMTAQLVATHRPGRLVACLDLDWRPAFRVELLPSYKTHRVAEEAGDTAGGIAEEVPDALSPQVDMILEVLDAIGIATGGAEGLEADDVLGTLAGREAVDPVVLVSGDRDLLQCADDGAPGVRVLYIGRGIAKAEMYTPADVAARYGLPPERAGRAYAELALLRGDPSDGLPGVPGIGEKTASKLLLQYGSLAAVRAAAAQSPSPLPARVAAALVASSDYLDAAWDVVWVRRDAEVVMSRPDALPAEPRDPQRLAALAEELRITAQVDRLLAALR